MTVSGLALGNVGAVSCSVLAGVAADLAAGVEGCAEEGVAVSAGATVGAAGAADFAAGVEGCVGDGGAVSAGGVVGVAGVEVVVVDFNFGSAVFCFVSAAAGTFCFVSDAVGTVVFFSGAFSCELEAGVSVAGAWSDLCMLRFLADVSSSIGCDREAPLPLFISVFGAALNFCSFISFCWSNFGKAFCDGFSSRGACSVTLLEDGFCSDPAGAFGA